MPDDASSIPPSGNVVTRLPTPSISPVLISSLGSHIFRAIDFPKTCKTLNSPTLFDMSQSVRIRKMLEPLEP